MTRSPLLALLLIGAACSATPQGAASDQAARSRPQAGDRAAPRGPQPPGATDPVPRDAPDPTIRNVAATIGRANLPETKPPFAVAPIGDFDAPFAMAFLPDGRLLVTEKAGVLKLREPDGRVQVVEGAPAVAQGGQGGLLDVAVPPDFARSGAIYLTYAEPAPVGSQLVLARASIDTGVKPCVLAPCWQSPKLNDLSVIWRSGSYGLGGQFGAIIMFSPDGKHLFLTSGERQRFSPAQDSEQALGKILRLTLDGKAAPGNPMYAAGGVRAMTWSSGHRNPYGLVFTPDGRLWEEEMGPKGGDELNLIEPGRNYGWPIVSNGDNYSGKPIPDHPSRPDLAAPVLWWNPSISPGGMIAYSGALFPQYRGDLLIAGLGSESLIRIEVNGTRAAARDQWAMGSRIRDVAQAPDGAIWLLEDGGQGSRGRLLRLTPRR